MINRGPAFCYLFLFVLLCSSTGLYAQDYQPAWSSLNQRPVPQWWSDAKFGIFIHWGLYSVPAYAPVNEVEGVYEKYAEHYLNRLLQGNQLFTEHHTRHYGNGTYQDFAPMFEAKFFDPNEWADLFKRSGAGYVVLTSKHHDGYCLWPSEHSSGWNSVDTGPRRDLIQELSLAVRRAGLKMGLYYSLLEWDNPLYTPETIEDWVSQHMIPQMKDLVNRYEPNVIFADGEWDYTSAELKSEQFLAWLYNESAVKDSVVVNDRWGKETRSRHGGYYTTEYDLIGHKVNTGRIEHPWEESRGIGTSYGYNQFETAEHYASSSKLIHLLIEKVSNGGNLLLNIGPKANGLIPVIMQQRLLDIGSWLEVNGEAIYGTTAWTEQPAEFAIPGIYFTQKETDLYVLCTRWPKKSLSIKGVRSADTITLLGFDEKVNYAFTEDQLTISLPALNPATMPCDYAWAFKVENFKP